MLGNRYLLSVEGAAHLQVNTTEFNLTVTCGVLLYAFNNLRTYIRP
jgi:hypothetical protein